MLPLPMLEASVHVYDKKNDTKKDNASFTTEAVGTRLSDKDFVSFWVLIFAYFMIVSFMLSCEGNKVNKYYCHCYKNSSQYQTFQTLYENKRMGDLRLHLICVFIFGCICIICQ